MLISQAFILHQLLCPKLELSRTHYLHFLASNMSFAGTRGMAFPTAKLMTGFAHEEAAAHPTTISLRIASLMTYSLDQATELEKIDGNRFRREVDETWWNFDNAFGGWAAATAFSAIKAHDDCRGELLSLNAVFARPIKAGLIEVQTDVLARRKQSDFWRVTISSAEQPDETLVAFDIVMGRKRAFDEDSFEKIMPDAPEPESVEKMNMEGMGPVWLQHYQQRPFIGTPFKRNVSPKTCVWVSHKDERPIDTKALVALSDTPMPRVFFTSTTPRFGSTISFSVSSTCGEDVLKTLQTKCVLIEADSRNVGRGSYDQLVNIWSECGSLLSVSNQTAVFR